MSEGVHYGLLMILHRGSRLGGCRVVARALLYRVRWCWSLSLDDADMMPWEEFA